MHWHLQASPTCWATVTGRTVVFPARRDANKSAEQGHCAPGSDGEQRGQIGVVACSAFAEMKDQLPRPLELVSCCLREAFTRSQRSSKLGFPGDQGGAGGCISPVTPQRASSALAKGPITGRYYQGMGGGRAICPGWGVGRPAWLAHEVLKTGAMYLPPV